MTAVIGGIILVAACSPVDDSDPGSEATGDVLDGGTLVIGQDTEPVGFDPVLTPAWGSQNIYEFVYEPLLRVGDDGTPAANLAESWALEGESSYVFTLRQGVTFHDGSGMTAEDVKFSIDRSMAPGSVTSGNYAEVSAVSVVDDYTVRVDLERPTEKLLNILTSPALSQIVPAEAEGLEQHPVGTGPFVFDEYVSGSHITLSRFEDYWDEDRPHLDEIRMQIITDEAARLNAIRTGQIDMTFLRDPVTAQTLEQEGRATLIDSPNNKPVGLLINHAVPPLDNPDVRRAISLAINREEMIDIVVGGMGALSTAVPPSDPSWMVPEPEDLPYNEFDPDKARTLLADAGFPSGLDLELKLPSDFPLHVKDGELVQAYLKEIGINLTLVSEELGTHVESLQNRDFDMLITGLSPFPDPDSYFRPDFHSGSEITRIGYSTPELDALLDEALYTVDADQRRELYFQVQEILAEDAAMVWLYSEPIRFEVVQSKVKDYVGIDKHRSRYPAILDVTLTE